MSKGILAPPYPHTPVPPIIIHIEETDSTINWLRERKNSYLHEDVAVVANFQTAGRGQGTNSWESEKGKNILMSVLTHPNAVAPHSQFLLSMCGALAVKDVAESYAGNGITLKWPNDVYWKDCKLSGTLIETSIKDGQINDCIFGIGLNVNQTQFVSDAPNPVSLAQIIGHEVNLEKVSQQLIEALGNRCEMLYNGEEKTIVKEYHNALYRKNGFYTYEDERGVFEAELVGVLPSGHIELRDRTGTSRRYAFKEVKYCINFK